MRVRLIIDVEVNEKAWPEYDGRDVTPSRVAEMMCGVMEVSNCANLGAASITASHAYVLPKGDPRPWEAYAYKRRAPRRSGR